MKYKVIVSEWKKRQDGNIVQIDTKFEFANYASANILYESSLRKANDNIVLVALLKKKLFRKTYITVKHEFMYCDSIKIYSYNQ